MGKTKAQLRAEAVERLRKLNCMDVSGHQVLEAAVDDSGENIGYRVEIRKLIDLLTDDTHESRGSYEERLYDVPVSDCPYCGCKRVVIHDFSDIYENPHSYRVEHMDEKEAFKSGCFETYYAFDSAEKAVEHANMRVLLLDEPTNGDDDGIPLVADGIPLDAAESHGDAPESVLSANADTDKGESAKAAQDSREKLEEDVEKLRKKWKEYNGNYMRVYSYVAYAQIIELLDRQAAITERHWMEICGANANANIELKRQIDALEANNAQLHTLIAELQDERDMYRDKLGRAIDAAHKIVRMVDE